MSDVKLCDCCGMRIELDKVFHEVQYGGGDAAQVLDICTVCMDVILEKPLAKIRKVRRPTMSEIYGSRAVLLR